MPYGTFAYARPTEWQPLLHISKLVLPSQSPTVYYALLPFVNKSNHSLLEETDDFMCARAYSMRIILHTRMVFQKIERYQEYIILNVSIPRFIFLISIKRTTVSLLVF